MKYVPIPVLTPGMYIKVVMNLVFIMILFVKILTPEFIGLHPYMCQVGSQVQEQAYMKLPRDGQILGFNLYSFT